MGHWVAVVYLRASPERTRVALVCGGGSGHEPSHAGFVGQHQFGISHYIAAWHIYDLSAKRMVF
jgi:hypothetical protein